MKRSAFLLALLSGRSSTAFHSPTTTRSGRTRLHSSSRDLSDLRVMVNGMPGPMATAAAESCLRKGLKLAPVGLTGPDVPPQTITVTDASTGRSQSVKLVPASNREEADSSLEGLVAGCGENNLVAVDYTHPSAIYANAEWYVENGLPFVMGTTGGDREKLLDLAGRGKANAVIAPNMGKQIVAMQAALEYLETKFPGSFEGYDLKVTESHQKKKADTSGTAKAVVGSLAVISEDAFDAEEDIEMLRSDEESLAFGVPEEGLDGHAFHTYTLTSGDGSVRFKLEHNVVGRSIYADGTADAVKFLAGKLGTEKDGRVYSMVDVLEENALN